MDLRRVHLIETHKIVRYEEYVNVLGYSSQEKHRTHQQLLTTIHPDDCALFIGFVDQLTPQNSTLQISYRVLQPDGSPVWLEKSVKAFFDEQGKLLRSEIHLTVSDSGVGFDIEAAKVSRGIGLISMEERLKLLNGTFSIKSHPQRGTTIHARVPFSSRKDSLRAVE